LVRTLLHAEQLAPRLIRTNIFVRETVADLLRQARRDAGGGELRGLAWRRGRIDRVSVVGVHRWCTPTP
jgi:hypothetical protein